MGNRQATVVRYYTFLSSRGCRWLLRDLKSRPQPPTVKSPVVTEQAFKGAEKVIHAAGLRWHDLRDYFHQSFEVLYVSSRAVRFMLGHPLKKEEERYMNAFNPQAIGFLRQTYVKVERQFFT